ncbi:MAG: alpha-glucosidase, partial [Hymenobacter sp.]
AKDPAFPPMPGLTAQNYTNAYNHGPHLHDYLQEMNREVFSKYNLMTVAEGAGRNPQEAMNFVDPARKELDMTYHFDAVSLGDKQGHVALPQLKAVFTKWEQEFATKGWQAIYLASHDQARLVSRFGDDRPAFREPSTKLLNTFLLSMHGTPYCYYGDELGMTNIRFNTIADYRDVAARNGYELVKNQGGSLPDYLATLNVYSRDNGRTPFQWNATANAGFTTGTPWLKVNPNYLTINEETQNKDSTSVLNHFRKAVALRQQHPVLIYGQYQLLDAANPHIYAYTRTQGSSKALVVLNFSAEQRDWALPAGLTLGGAPWLNNYPTFTPAATLALRPWQAVVLPLK